MALADELADETILQRSRRVPADTVPFMLHALGIPFVALAGATVEWHESRRLELKSLFVVVTRLNLLVLALATNNRSCGSRADLAAQFINHSLEVAESLGQILVPPILGVAPRCRVLVGFEAGRRIWQDALKGLKRVLVPSAHL